MPEQTNLVDIKDMTPNPKLIEMLESLLKKAKSGEIRTAVWMAGWDDDSVTHGWALDARSSSRRILAEMVLLTNDFTVNIGLLDDDSVLSRAFKIE